MRDLVMSMLAVLLLAGLVLYLTANGSMGGERWN